MRLPTVLKLFALGLAARAIVRYQRGRKRTRPRADRFARDPGDPVQAFDGVSELQVFPLALDVRPLDDMALAGFESDLAGLDPRDEIEVELLDIDVVTLPRDAGDLYGVHTPIAVERSLPDDDAAFNDGQNWIEALETSAIENGAEREIELEIVDDEDLLRPPHRSVTRDTPIADYGSAGRRGL
jgi:hypothetical protein